MRIPIKPITPVPGKNRKPMRENSRSVECLSGLQMIDSNRNPLTEYSQRKIESSAEVQMDNLVLKQSQRSAVAAFLLVLSLALFAACSAVHQVHSSLQSDHNHVDSREPAESQDWAKQR